ncbi:MAG TPA: nickel pincer cofactor biosynthesis protein LarC [Actinomycetes bacterium]|nr:nickel pincer cofactor biosynthesis protein LarC [Actinomycetes bacterium]
MTGTTPGGAPPATPFAYFDCFAGVAGDMVLGALLDAGASEERLRAGLARVPVDPFELEVEAVERGGIGATQVVVRTGPPGGLRTWAELRATIGGADLPGPVRDRALATFARLAEAEGRVHRVPADRVHFHEVGAVDAVVDVVGAALLLDDLGVAELWASPVATGSGFARAGHGVVPVPAPAVLELLRGTPVHAGGVAAELTTPTGAAILAASAARFGELPPLRLAAVGYGAGSRVHRELPNLLRVVLGERLGGGPAGDAGLVLEANIDDMTPELAPWVLERLFEAGASDAWLTPVHMKRGRPGVTLSVLCPPGADAAIREVLWRETSTLGVRGLPVRRWMLERRLVEVEVPGGKVRVKLGLDGGRVVNLAPEYADCARLATETGQPLKEVMARAQAAAQAAVDAGKGTEAGEARGGRGSWGGSGGSGLPPE